MVIHLFIHPTNTYSALPHAKGKQASEQNKTVLPLGCPQISGQKV